MTKIRDIESFFTAEERKNPLLQFVSNEEDFKIKLKTHSYDKIFTDHLRADFGHGTGVSHDLIANNLIPALEKQMMNSACPRN